jgi:hypothetical protein
MMTFYNIAVPTVLILAFSLHDDTADVIMDAFKRENIWTIVYLGVVPGVGGHLLMTLCIPYLD